MVGAADHACSSSFASTQSIIFYISAVINDNTWYSTDAKYSIYDCNRPTAAYYYVFGDGIPAWYQSSDLAAFSAPLETSFTTTSSSSIAITTKSTPTRGIDIRPSENPPT
jgi:hypothetical protein